MDYKKRKIIEEITMYNSDVDSDAEKNRSISSLSSDSSYDDHLLFKKRRKLTRILNFVELTIIGYDDVEFKEHFRVQRSTCYYLIGQVEEDKVLPSHSFGREKITSEKAVLMTIWYLSNTETFRQISDRFNVTKSTSYRIIEKIIKYLVTNSKRYIRWPDRERKEVIHRGFQNLNGIRRVIGAIDGTHINIKRPKENSYVYCNRKSEYSILLQGVCDHQKRFIDIFCGEAGSLHDLRLLKRSSLYDKCYNGFLGEDVLLGDSAYPCLSWLISPFRDNGNLNQRQNIFNYRHSATRIVIENAFGLLKGRFRRLKFFENFNIIFIVQCVVAATVLHNICLNFNDEIDYEPDPYSGNDDIEESIGNISGMIPNDFRRNEIMQEMFQV